MSVPVWFGDLRLGLITVAPDGALSLAYEPKWLATKGAFALSETLPLRSEPFGSDIISPWLANLLPEERQLAILTKSLGLDRADTLALLEAIGGDTAGALSFGQPTPQADWDYVPLTKFYGLDDPKAALERHFQDLENRPFLAGEEGVRLSLAGGQKKTALALLDADGHPVLRLPQAGDVLAIPRNGAPSSLILKPDNENLPGIVENEAYCLALARAVGIEAAQATIAPAGSRKALCVLRYDRRLSEQGRVLRLHQEDFAQANGVPPGRKYEHGTLAGPSLAQILATGNRLPPKDALALLDQVLFNILVANTDAHAKNYSILRPVGGGLHLAPLYDVSTVLAWDHVVQTLAQKIAGKRRKPADIAARHWDAIAADANYRPADLRKRVQELVDAFVAKRVEVTHAICGLEGAAPGYVEQAAALVEANVLRIGGRLGGVTN